MRMTGAGNTIFKRSFFLACGGFPQNELFKKFGGEDGALGIATTKITEVATLFNEPGVIYNCRESVPAKRLLDSILFEIRPENITDQDIQKANEITEEICKRYNELKQIQNNKIGISHLKLEWK